MENNFVKIYCDGGARGNPGPAASAFVVFDEHERIIAREGEFIGNTTNNVAEYKAVIMALNWLSKNKPSFKEIFFFLDSELVVNQLTGKFRVKDRKLQELVLQIKKLEKNIPGEISYKSVPRKENKITDLLVNKTLDALNSGTDPT